MKHIEFSTLLEKFEGQLSVRETAAIESHSAACQNCRETYGKLADLFAYTPPEAIEIVPQAATARILNIYQRKPTVLQPASARWFGLDDLVFDDWQTALSERFSGIDSRQLLFSLGTYDLDLRVELIGDKCLLSGQIFPEATSATVEAVCGDFRSTAVINDLGEFVLEPLPQGVYCIRITADCGIDLNIEQVPLKH